MHYGDEKITWSCVESIIDNNFVDILIADNDPKQKIEIPQKFKNKISLFRTGGTAGFAQANNAAAKIGRTPDHSSVLLLNNDTIVLPGAIQKLRELLNEKDIGAVGPCMPFADQPERIWACGGIIKKYRVVIHGFKKIKQSTPYDTDYLPGAAILCKTNVWDLVGGLPEKYYLAYEEAEFALRIKKLNFRVVVEPGARILHKVGMSSDTQPMYTYNGIRNRIRFGRYLWGKLTGFFLAAFWCLVDVRKKKNGLTIWLYAIKDEVCGVGLNREALQNIKNLFP